MTTLERVELALRRVHDRRVQQHREQGAVLNIAIQKLLEDVADELRDMRESSPEEG